MHYFDTKEDLFAACLQLPLRPDDAESLVFGDGIESAGRNVARMFFTVWDDPDSRTGLVAMLGGAFTNETAASALREFFTSVLVKRLAVHLDAADAELRMSLVASHLVGIAVLRYVVGFEQLRAVPTEDLVEIIAPRLQDYLTG